MQVFKISEEILTFVTPPHVHQMNISR